jgi:uncharacterized membrane protein
MAEQIHGPEKDQRLEIAMGNMLRFGVTASAIVVLLGGVLYLAQMHGPTPDYRHFHAAPAMHLGAILTGVAHLQSESLIELGILLLIATPVCRVIFGLVGFALLKDRFYTAVSAIVLAVLLLSFFGGH